MSLGLCESLVFGLRALRTWIPASVRGEWSVLGSTHVSSIPGLGPGSMAARDFDTYPSFKEGFYQRVGQRESTLLLC